MRFTLLLSLYAGRRRPEGKVRGLRSAMALPYLSKALWKFGEYGYALRPEDIVDNGYNSTFRVPTKPPLYGFHPEIRCQKAKNQ